MKLQLVLLLFLVALSSHGAKPNRNFRDSETTKKATFDYAAMDLDAIKREVRRSCYHKHDLKPSLDSPERFSHNDAKQDAMREHCYQLKVHGRKLKKANKLMQKLKEEAEVQDQPSPGTIRFGSGPLEHIKPADVSASTAR